MFNWATNGSLARGWRPLDYIIEQELRLSELKPVQSPNTNNFCSYCKRPGHTFAECRTRKFSNESRSPRGPRPNNNSPREVTCYKCDTKGHYANECPNLQSSRNTRRPPTRPFRRESGNSMSQLKKSTQNVEIEKVNSKN